MNRSIEKIIQTIKVLEGGGFPVRRPFPTDELDQVDPFLLLDHLGPIEWGPGEAIGAPDHPHRCFNSDLPFSWRDRAQRFWRSSR